jgi:branched-chain amino acid transport system substrate-binding protein
MKKLTLGLLCAILIIGGLFSGCSSSTTAVKTLDIAIVAPLTGPAANVGTNYQRAVEMAIEDINAAGGVTIAGQKYVLSAIVRDDKFDEATAKTIAEEMIFNNGVKVIMGCSQKEGPAVVQTTNANKTILFSMSPTPQMQNPDLPYDFALGGIVTQQYATVLDYVKKYYPTAKTMVTLYADQNDAPLETGGAKTMAEYYGLTYLGYELFPFPTTTDFAPFAQKLMTYNADIIDLSGCGGATGALEGTMIKQIREAGFKGIILQPTVPPPGIMETIPAEYLYKIVTNDININGSIVTDTYRNLVNRYHVKYGDWPIDFLAQAYNGVHAFFTFLNGQDSMDTQKWMEGFANYKWTGVYGEAAQWVGKPDFGINRALMTNFWASEWKNGVLETEYVATLPTQLWISK